MAFTRTWLAAALGLGLALSGPAGAAAAATVGTTAAPWTPYLLPNPTNQVVQELEPCHGKMYAVGRIAAVGRGSTTYTRSNAFSFSATTGAVTGWAPRTNGMIRSIAFSPDCSTAYIGGLFTTVNGVSARHIAAVNTRTGALRTLFARHVNRQVDTVRYAHGQVIVGGTFSKAQGVGRARMASLDPITGAATSYLDLDISGAYPRSTGKVYNSQLSGSGDRLLIEGVFTSIDGHPRQQVAVLDLGPLSVSLDGWTSPEFSQPCTTPWYARGANWSPDDTTIYIATTGYKPTSGPGSNTSDPRAGLCDSVSAFPSTSRSVSHTWINYTGCDSFYAVVADATNVYVGGHQRWVDNGHGCDAAGPGALSRPGIAAMDPTTGLATAWNPTRSRGHGTNQLLLTKAGLWLASDTWRDGGAQMCGGALQHGGICFLPY